jgi:hypothetical protein
MPPAHLFVVILVLACPIYVVLHAMSLVIPLYLLLLAFGLGLMYLLLRPSKGLLFDEVFSLLTLFGGVACLVVGFALSPLLVQVLAAIALVILGKRYQIDAEVS